MERWNGWGEEGVELPVRPGAQTLMEASVGPATRLKDATLEEALARVPASRIDFEHRLIATDSDTRLRHSRGHSFPDWLARRSGDFGHYPDGVAFPTSSADVRELLSLAEEKSLELIPWGGGTSVAGHVNPDASERPILTISMRRMNMLLSLDKESQLATFGAGTRGPEVEAQLRDEGYTLGHFPQSFEYSTLGGWVVTRSSGQQSLRYGRIEQLFAGGHLETPIGPLELPPFPASSAGPDVREMVLGSEGRMGIVTEVKVRVTPLPEMEEFHTLFFANWAHGVRALRELTQAKLPLSMLRLSNATETRSHLAIGGNAKLVRVLHGGLGLRGLGDDKVMVMFGITGDKATCKHVLRETLRRAKDHGGVHLGQALGKRWAHHRYRGVYLRNSLWDLGYSIDTLETCTHWSNITALMRGIEAAIGGALSDEGEKVHVFTHLSHFYPSGASVYTSYVFRCADSYEATHARWAKCKAAASEYLTTHGGTISHQHGVGKDHAAYLPREKGPLGMRAIETLAGEFDPKGLMNPGTLLPRE